MVIRILKVESEEEPFKRTNSMKEIRKLSGTNMDNVFYLQYILVRFVFGFVECETALLIGL